MSSRTISKATASPDWIGAHRAAKLIGRSYRVLKRLVEQGHVRTHSLPGSWTYYNVADLMKLVPPGETEAK